MTHLLSEVSQPYFILRIDTLYNCIEFPHIIKKSNNLKSVFWNTLLQTSNTLQPKQKSLHISAVPRKHNKTAQYVRDEILPQISELITIREFL